MKIYIMGASGSGKTTFAKNFAAKYNIPVFNLDDIKWINGKEKHYIKSRTYEERKQKISKIINDNTNWVFEGVYFQDWVDEIFDKADEVVILQKSILVCQYRCIKRAIKQFNYKTTSFRSLIDLLRWNKDYYSKYMPETLKKLQAKGVKYRIIKTY